MTTTRRVFLKVMGAGAGALSVGVPMGCPSAAAGPIDAGNVSDLAEGQTKAVDGAGVIVGRDAGGIYAMTSICTHLGCDLSGTDGAFNDDGTFHCNCHGSDYSADGVPTPASPAKQPLKHFKVELGADGAITVQGGEEVGADVRVAVPA